MLVAAIVALAFGIAYSRFGTRIASTIPLWAFVLVQAFRLPLELAMHGMYTRGIMPVQMTYTGLNFDIITGATAIPVAILAATGTCWSRASSPHGTSLGLGLLINVVTVAILGTPRFRYFGDDHLNVWVTYPPFVWLPAVMVLAALAGHLLIFRALVASDTPIFAARPASTATDIAAGIICCSSSGYWHYPEDIHRKQESRAAMSHQSLEDVLQSAGSPVQLLRNSQIGPYAFPVVPSEFTNWRDEQRSWRETCALFDQSHHMTDLYLDGPDALRLLSDLGVNTFKNFKVNQAKQFVACNHDGLRDRRRDSVLPR